VLCLFAFAFCSSPLIVNFYFAKREKERKSFCFFKRGESGGGGIFKKITMKNCRRKCAIVMQQ
jgi:hypothetical protein